jgi:hypothetical protein
MHVNFRNKDFWSGVMLLVIGLGAGWIAEGYTMGTVLRMGSGYFPTLLSGILCVFGVLLMLRAMRTTESIEGGWSLRALILLPLSFALFGFLLDRAGFVPAMMVLVTGSALAGSEFRLLEVLALAVFMTVLAIGVFIYGLNLPYQMIVWPPSFRLH